MTATNLTIRQLEVFAMASRCTSFSEAAKRLGISQPSLSATVAKLEQQLGLSLFDRSSRSLRLTAQGQRMAVVAGDLVRNFEEAVRSLDDVASTRRGSTSLAVVPSVAAGLAAQALTLFYEDYPDFLVTLHDTPGAQAAAMVNDRVVDFGIFARPAEPSDLLMESLLHDPFVVVCRSDSPLAGRKSVGWGDLAEIPLIVGGIGRLRRDIENAWLQAGLNLRPRFVVEQIRTALALVDAGLGVTLIPRLHQLEARQAGLATIPARMPLERELVMVRRADRVLPAPVEHLMACFRRAVLSAEEGAAPRRGGSLHR
ncbi:LysR family transcriptional regulator [Massilia terrae]|uniref:LysR family transcriptional regulator n=1 Tax=Massilia terrae TaxID=1811224 RepID=A0ABT2D4D6_9BURK|nr:LysR family transcriptional regulator [Massilia terrae]